MSHELTFRRDHLHRHRRMILGRSLAAALAGAIPIPLVDDWLVYAIHRSTLRRLADDAGVDLGDEAARALIHGDTPPPSFTKMTGAAVAYRLLARRFRKFVITYFTINRAQAAATSFVRATLFDHYCARMHVGMGLDRDAALALRRLMDRAAAETPGGLGRHVFRKALVASVRASARAPFEVVDIATGGRLRKLLARGDDEPIAAVEVDAVDTALEALMGEREGFLARASAAVELQISAEGNPYLDRLIDAFERLWREAHDPAGERAQDPA